MTMITPSYLGETIEYSSLHACRSTLEDPTARSVLLTGWVVVFVICLQIDQSVYHRMLDRIAPTVAMVTSDAGKRGRVDAVTLVDVPEDPSGVIYLRRELVERLKLALPGVPITPDASAPGQGMNYVWVPDGDTLLKLQ